MDYELMDAFKVVQKDLVKEGMSEKEAEILMNKVIWNLICRI